MSCMKQSQENITAEAQQANCHAVWVFVTHHLVLCSPWSIASHVFLACKFSCDSHTSKKKKKRQNKNFRISTHCSTNHQKKEEAFQGSPEARRTEG